MSFHVYNSLSNQLEPFEPQDGATVRLYNCGPTVYNYNHIGNFRSYIFVDQLRRYLLLRGYTVDHTSNITDVEDKIIENALKQNKDPGEFTAPFIQAFLEDLQTLRIQEVEHRPTATGSMSRIIEMISTLEKQGFTYQADGSVYFRIQDFSDYGMLSGIDPETLKTAAGGRFDADEYDKENVRDFALWKSPAAENEPSWQSPWGPGRPGWHIECSAMIRDTYGERGVDIHCGGVDLLFPHHENEIAQSRCAYPHDNFVRYWMHNEHLLVDGKKMSKSAGNFFTLRDLTIVENAKKLVEQNRAPAFLVELIEKARAGRALRYLLASTHYRTRLNFTFDNLHAADAACDRLRSAVSRLREYTGWNTEDFGELYKNKMVRKSIEANAPNAPGQAGDAFASGNSEAARAMKLFLAAMDDDLNIAKALGSVFDFVRDLNTMIDRGISMEEAEDAAAYLYAVDSVLDVMDLTSSSSRENEQEAYIQDLIEKRNAARKNKDFQSADQIRDQLASEGIRIKDTPQGTTWEKL